MSKNIYPGVFPEINDRVRREVAIRCGHDHPERPAQWSLGFEPWELRSLVSTHSWIGPGNNVFNETIWGATYMVYLDLLREGFFARSAADGERVKLKTPNKKRSFRECLPQRIYTTRGLEIFRARITASTKGGS